MRGDSRRWIAPAGAAAAVLAFVPELDFFFGPGTSEVLKELARHAFVLVLLLAVTAGTRTVSLGMLGIFWLLGVWAVVGAAYLAQKPFEDAFGTNVREHDFMVVWWAPFTEEALKALPVAAYFWMMTRSGLRQPAMTDGLLLGFMVGAGVSFHEDAQIGKIVTAGHGWGEASGWSNLFPTMTLGIVDAVSLNHALWGALSGLSVGAAFLFRHSRPLAWVLLAIGPLLAFTNHVLVNYLAGGVTRGGPPSPFSTIDDLTSGGRITVVLLNAGIVAAVAIELLIQRWAARRDRVFPPLPLSRVLGLVKGASLRAALAQLAAAEGYVGLRRSLHLAGWRARQAGEYPDFSEADYRALMNGAATFGLTSRMMPARQPAGGETPPPQPQAAPTEAAAPAEAAVPEGDA
jgi:hypothetical protein